MYIIAGLGNPGNDYKNTRHNIGFDAIDVIADKNRIVTEIAKHKALLGKGYIEGERALLVKPQTFMNLSGQSLREVVDFYKINVEEELIVIYDDIDLSPGQIRIRQNGSAGGHNGMKNIISLLGSQNFTRIRIGVGEKPKGYDLADYVLSHFSKDERKIMDESVIKVEEALRVIIKEGVGAAMTKFNGKA